MAMLLRSLRARVIGRGARNYRAYAELAAAYEESATGGPMAPGTACSGCPAGRPS